MKRKDRAVIENIIAAEPYVYKWQDAIEKEQERIIGDLVSPASKVVRQLIALDNERVDLCNIKVLCAFIERGLGAEYGLLSEQIARGEDSPLFEKAADAIRAAGYGLARAQAEFEYLFKKLPKARVKRQGCLAETAMGAQCAALVE